LSEASASGRGAAGTRRGNIGLRVENHSSLGRPEYRCEAAVLHDRVAFEGVVPAIVSGIGSSLRWVGLEDKKFGGHGLPAGSVFRVGRVGEPRACVPEDNIGGG